MSTVDSSYNPCHSQMVISIRTLLLLPMFCAGLMMLVTFSVPGRSAGPDEVDGIAKLKLLVRGTCALAMSLLLIWQINRIAIRRAIRQMLPWFVFLGWCILSTCWSPLRTITLGQAGSQMTLAMMSVVIAGFWRGDRDTSTIVRFLSLSLTMISGILLSMYVAIPSAGSLSRDGEGLLHATNGSATASLGILLSIGAALAGKWRWARLVAAPTVMLHGTVLIIAANRTALALTLLLSLVLIACCASRFWICATLFGISIVATLYLALDPGGRLASTGERELMSFAMRGQTSRQLQALSGRAELWNLIWKSHQESPWIGHGFFVTSKTGSIRIWNKEGNVPAHNIWLQALVTTGIIGTVLFLSGIVGTCFATIVRLALRRESIRLAFLMAILMCFYLGWSLTSDSLLGPIQPETVVFYVMLGVAIGTLSHAGRCPQLEKLV